LIAVKNSLNTKKPGFLTLRNIFQTDETLRKEEKIILKAKEVNMWEYLEVITNVNRLVGYVNGSSVDEETGEEWMSKHICLFPDFINTLGQDNWELVTSTQIGTKEDIALSYVFKRLKSGVGLA
jgi:hypothetical protein